MTNPVIPHAPCRGIFQLCRKPLQLAHADEAVPKIYRWFLANNCAAFRRLQCSVRLRETTCAARAGGGVDARARNAAGMGNIYVQA